MLTKLKFLNAKKWPGIYHIFTEKSNGQNKTSWLQFVTTVDTVVDSDSTLTN